MWTRTVYLVLFQCLLAPLAATAPFGFTQVREEAQQLAQRPFAAVTNAIPADLQKLSYDQYQAIQFDRRQALWSGQGLPFAVSFFLPGALHKNVVRIYEVTEQAVRPVPFSPSSFSSGTNRLSLPANLGYAGFRVLEPQARFGEVASFLDASYFRMIGRGQGFGASARGLALNTSHLGQEEFPVFRAFWLRKPARTDQALTVWALLDSPSVAGAFEFVIQPGLTTICRTQATFYPRRQVEEFGVAALTSMFFYDLNSHPPLADFRPEVHDSDGLAMQTGRGQALWRPLDSGKAVRVNDYLDTNPSGFGLMQRERAFSQYQDLVARYDLRPSVWVKTLGNWGKGRVELVQLPTNNEYNDNVVAFWVPDPTPKPGQAFEIAYELHWLTNHPTPPALGYVQATRIGRAGSASASGSNAQNLRFVIDFAGPALERLPAAGSVTAAIQCGEGAVVTNHTVARNEVNGTWRLVLEITSPPKAVDLQAALMHLNRRVTETWMFTWQP